MDLGGLPVMTSRRKKRKPASALQQWARERNMAGGRLRGIISMLRGQAFLHSTPLKEAEAYFKAAEILANSFRTWKANEEASRQQFIGKGSSK